MEFLLTIIVIFAILNLLLRKIFPLLLAWYVKRKMKRYGGFYGNPGAAQTEMREEAGRSKAQEGKVTVTTLEEHEKVIEKDMGEYVDFEEEKL